MSHTNEAVAAATPPAAGWTLHAGGRQFGPMSDEELRRFFTSGVVTHADRLTNEALGLSESAAEAAVRLQVAAPKAAPAATSPLPPPVRHVTMQRVENSGRRAMVLAAVMLVLAGVYAWMPHNTGNPFATLLGRNDHAWVVEANRLEDANQWQAARTHAERWIAKAPSSDAWLYEGRALVHLGHPLEAESAFRKGLALSPEDAVIQANLGSLYFDQRQFARAVDALRASVQNNASAPGTWYTLGRAYSMQSLHAQALAAFRTATNLDPNDSGSWTEIGYELYRTREWQAAVAPLEKAIALEPGYNRPRQILAAVRDSLAGRAPQQDIAPQAPGLVAAVVDAGAAAPSSAASPVSPDTEASPTAGANVPWDYWRTEAEKLEDQQDWLDLRNFAERWTQERPREAMAWAMLGTALRNLRKWNEAVQALERAGELAPNDVDIQFKLGLAYSANHDFAHAITVYQRVLGLSPRYAAAWNNLGSSYEHMGQYPAALEAFKSSVEIDASNAIAWNNIGLLNYRMNRFAESIDAYERALKLDPDNETAKTWLQRAKQR